MQLRFEHNEVPVTLQGFENDHVTRAIQRSGDFYEPSVLDFIEAQSVKGTVVDVGAHIGNHTVFMGLFTPAEKIIAIEPYAPAAQLLSANITENNIGDRVVQLTCAAGIVNGRLGLKPGKLTNRGHTKVISGDEVEERPLDEITEGDEVSLVKIDVEGYELEVIFGAINLIKEQRPTLIVEASTSRRKRQLGNLLESFGYQAQRVSTGTRTFAYTTRSTKIEAA